MKKFLSKHSATDLNGLIWLAISNSKEDLLQRLWGLGVRPGVEDFNAAFRVFIGTDKYLDDLDRLIHLTKKIPVSVLDGEIKRMRPEVLIEKLLEKGAKPSLAETTLSNYLIFYRIENLGNLKKLINFYLDRGGEKTDKFFRTAITRKQKTDVLRLLDGFGFPIPEGSMTLAIEGGNLDSIAYLGSIGIPIDWDLMENFRLTSNFKNYLSSEGG